MTGMNSAHRSRTSVASMSSFMGGASGKLRKGRSLEDIAIDSDKVKKFADSSDDTEEEDKKSDKKRSVTSSRRSSKVHFFF
ncbi:unnamed protein product [Anisakis simplex]|nr:unnamed protein product [Anisakis simplex]